MGLKMMNYLNRNPFKRVTSLGFILQKLEGGKI